MSHVPPLFFVPTICHFCNAFKNAGTCISYNRVFRIIHDLEMHSLICTALQPGLCLLMPCNLFFMVAQAGKETKRSLQTPQFCF